MLNSGYNACGGAIHGCEDPVAELWRSRFSDAPSRQHSDGSRLTTIADRQLLLMLLIAAISCTAITIAGLHYDCVPMAKWLNTSSGFFGLSAIFQARASGWFDSVLAFYGDDEKFPNGPPSHVTREIIDNPDTPVRTWLRNTLFFEARTALALGIVSIVLAMVAAWL